MTSSLLSGQFIKHFSLLALWPLVLLTPLVPFAAPSILVGHPWKPELFLSLLLIAAIVVRITRSKGDSSLLAINPITIGIAGFVVWSGMSVFWAASANSVFHHTFVWAAYLVFLLLLSNSILDRRFFVTSAYVLGVVAMIVSINCVIEYVLREQIDQIFGFRYGRYSEVWAAVIPLFLAFTVRSSGVKMVLSVAVTSLMWLAVLFSTSRTSLAATVGGVCLFFVAFLITRQSRSQFKKLALAVGLLFVFGVVTQLPIFRAQNEHKVTTFDRIATSSESDAGNSLGQNIRFLFAAVGLEMLRSNPLVGVGADNFGIEFNKYRATISAKSANAGLVTGNEDAIPERAHNEYLQVATELGIVGALIFASFLIAVVWLGIRLLRDSLDVYKLAAASGIVAFLFSSLFSSYSFRLVQNGVVFFFLVALLISKPSPKPRGSRLVLVAGLGVCVCLAVFSSMKAASQYMTYRGETNADIAASLDDLRTAEKLDSANAAGSYVAASRLLTASRYGEAAVHFQTAIDKGIGTSATYSYLISSHSLNGNDQAALESAAAAVKTFPYSTFLLTRYSVLLEKAGNAAEAQAQFLGAQEIDARQAETWRIFITQGARVAAEAGRKGVGIPLMADLYPQDGLYAMLAERQILHPEERYTMLGQ
ncbi:MAG: O-antigen ligase family protein [Pyrinomonadaceae bacterium]